MLLLSRLFNEFTRIRKQVRDLRIYKVFIHVARVFMAFVIVVTIESDIQSDFQSSVRKLSTNQLLTN